MGKKIAQVLAVLIFLCGLGFLLYPKATEWHAAYENNKVMEDFEKSRNYEMITERMKERPINRKKLILRIATVAAVVLALFILAANYALMHLLTITLGWNMVLSKILVEVVLFAVSFVVQGKFVYRGNTFEGKK